MKNGAVLATLLTWSVCPTAGQAKDKPEAKTPQAKAMALDVKGDVLGYVVDGGTLQPLADATVQIVPVEDAAESNSGKSDGMGFFSLKAPIGSVRSRFAWERVLDLSLASILSGGGKHKEKAINVTQFVLRVEKPGYKPFYGPVPVCKANADAKKFEVGLSIVALAPEGQPYTSYFYTPRQRQPRPIDFPTVAQPGDTITARGPIFSQYPLHNPTDKFRPYLLAYCGVKLVAESGLIQDSKDAPKVFVGTFEKSLPLSKDMSPCLLRVIVGGLQPAYVAIAPPPTKRDAIAQLVAKLNQGQGDSTFWQGKTFIDFELDGFDKIQALWPEAAGSIEGRRAIALQKINPSKALEAYERSEVKNPGLQTNIQSAIFWNLGEYDKAMALQSKNDYSFVREKQQYALMKAIEVRPRDYKSRLQLLTEAIGNAKIRAIALKDVPIPTATEEKLDYARLLLAQDKNEEALALTKSLQEDQKLGDAGRLSLANVQFQLGQFEAALANSEVAFAHLPVKPTKESVKTFDFYAFHQYGLLLLRAGQRDKAVEMLARALAQAREETHNTSAPIQRSNFGSTFYTVYTGPSVSAVVGYSYPEAAAAAVILEHLAAYDAPEANWLSTAILGRALVDAGLLSDGKALLLKVVAAQPNEIYPLLSLAVAQVKLGDLKTAQATVQGVLRLNPKEPQALLMQQDIKRALEGKSTSNQED